MLHLALCRLDVDFVCVDHFVINQNNKEAEWLQCNKLTIRTSLGGSAAILYI